MTTSSSKEGIPNVHCTMHNSRTILSSMVSQLQRNDGLYFSLFRNYRFYLQKRLTKVCSKSVRFSTNQLAFQPQLKFLLCKVIDKIISQTVNHCLNYDFILATGYRYHSMIDLVVFVKF